MRGHSYGMDVLGASNSAPLLRHELVGVFHDVAIGSIDVDALISRFDEIEPTNATAWSLWVENNHGIALAQRVTKDAQDILDKAIVPTKEFQFHDAVQTFAKRAEVLSSKITSQHMDDSPSPYWAEIKQYFIDGSRLANTLEDVLSGATKWSDVKDVVYSAGKGLGDAAKGIESTAKWTSTLVVGGAVVLGSALIYGAYKLLSGPAGQAVARRYLP